MKNVSHCAQPDNEDAELLVRWWQDLIFSYGRGCKQGRQLFDRRVFILNLERQPGHAQRRNRSELRQQIRVEPHHVLLRGDELLAALLLPSFASFSIS